MNNASLRILLYAANWVDGGQTVSINPTPISTAAHANVKPPPWEPPLTPTRVASTLINKMPFLDFLEKGHLVLLYSGSTNSRWCPMTALFVMGYFKPMTSKP